ncbi:uncharacterized protein LOC128242362 isoform X1 [Mya arenaria]|uniref:uncharacterized protein LOC128242362 isoform X1 n=1 Tax=Mya arenaria TaxID=6604 RepID=UPI0022E5E51B|nr:uncharacterized protein LOC128242362 isoform X1 [Mya arenaria]
METGGFTLLLFVTSLGSVQAYPTATHVWPLVPGNFSLDIVQNLADGDKGCHVTTGQAHPSLDYESAVFLGTQTSYVDVRVTDTSLVGGDFSILVHFAPLSTKGTILHYHQDQPAINPTDFYIKEIRAYYTESAFLVEFALKTVVYQYIDVRNMSMNNSWRSLIIQYDKGAKKLKLYLDQLVWESTAAEKLDLGLPGSIRFGAGQSETLPTFRGFYTCGLMWDTKVDETDYADALLECTSANWPVGAYESSIANQTCVTDRSSFEIFSKDTSLPSTVVTIGKMSTRSKIMCADRCSATDTCAGFTFTKGSKECNLYDSFYGAETAPLIGTDYYILKNTCC